MGGRLRTRWGVVLELGGTEMLPLLPAIRVRGFFRRDRESHGQHGIDTAKEVSLLATRADRVNVHRSYTSLREVGKVNRELYHPGRNHTYTSENS